MNSKVLKVHPDDNVIVALTDLKSGEVIHYQEQQYKILLDIPAKHKFSTKNLEVGDPVYMYGVVVGEALQVMSKGEPITINNVKHDTQEIHPNTEQYDWVKPAVELWKERTFMGYHRKDGKVGTANYWIIAPLVFCENRNIEVIRESMLRQLGYPDIKSQAIDIEPLITAYQKGVDIQALHLTRIGISKKDRVSQMLMA